MKRPQMPDHYERDAPEHHERVGIGSLNSISPVPENSHFPKDGEASPNRRKGMVDQPSEWETAHRMVSPENNGGWMGGRAGVPVPLDGCVRMEV